MVICSAVGTGLLPCAMRLRAVAPPDPCQRPALPVEPHRLVDLAEAEATPPHRHTVPMQDPTHRPPVDPELAAKLVDGRAGHVARNELLNLLALELPGRAWQPTLAEPNEVARTRPAAS